MPYVSPVVENDFKDRLNKCVDIIKNSSIKYQSLGILEATREMIIRPAVISTLHHSSGKTGKMDDGSLAGRTRDVACGCGFCNTAVFRT